MEATINGARIHHERSGTGPALVLIHAGVADSRMWDPQVSALEKHFDVIRADTRGFGKSELPPEPWSSSRDVVGLMDELGVKRAHLIACSIGGSAAIDIAIEHADRVSRVVLVSSGVGGMDFGTKYDELFLEVEAADKAGDLVGINEAEMRLWLDGPRRLHGYVKQPLRDLFLDMNGLSLGNDFTSAPRQAITPPAVGRLGEIKAPTLVVIGDEDLPTIMDAADLLMSSVPNVRKAVIHDAAHLPNLEHPEEFNRVVLDFLLAE
jgi:pimeloyl-ACP methyl ester carboxylesterase